MTSIIHCRNRHMSTCTIIQHSVRDVLWFPSSTRMLSWHLPPLMLSLILLLSLGPHVIHAGCREEHRDSCEAICPPNSLHNCTIRAAVILPASPIYEMSLQKILPALELAEQQIKKQQILPKNVKFEWMAYDDKCDASYAAVSAMDAYGKDCAHVIFGPACDYALGEYPFSSFPLTRSEYIHHWTKNSFLEQSGLNAFSVVNPLRN